MNQQSALTVDVHTDSNVDGYAVRLKAKTLEAEDMDLLNRYFDPNYQLFIVDRKTGPDTAEPVLAVACFQRRVISEVRLPSPVPALYLIPNTQILSVDIVNDWWQGTLANLLIVSLEVQGQFRVMKFLIPGDPQLALVDALA